MVAVVEVVFGVVVATVVVALVVAVIDNKLFCRFKPTQCVVV